MGWVLKIGGGCVLGLLLVALTACGSEFASVPVEEATPVDSTLSVNTSNRQDSPRAIRIRQYRGKAVQ